MHRLNSSPIPFLGHIASSDSGLLLHTVAWSDCVSVCLSVVTFVGTAKTAEPIEMLFVVVT